MVWKKISSLGVLKLVKHFRPICPYTFHPPARKSAGGFGDPIASVPATARLQGPGWSHLDPNRSSAMSMWIAVSAMWDGCAKTKVQKPKKWHVFYDQLNLFDPDTHSACGCAQMVKFEQMACRDGTWQMIMFPSSLECPSYAEAAGLSLQGISWTWGWFWDWFPIKAQKAPYDQLLSTTVANPTMHPNFWSILPNPRWIHHTARFGGLTVGLWHWIYEALSKK
jgi:hypothetical protein